MDVKSPLLIKLLLVGDSGVGKTSLLLRWTEDEFNLQFVCTIGIDFRSKFLELDEQRYKVQIWDTAGQERFRVIARAYYRGSMGLLMVYDVCNRKSFDNVVGWIKGAQENAWSHDHQIRIVLVANKVDLGEDRRVVSELEGRELAEKFNARYVETSAKSDIGVTQAFESLVRDAITEFFPPKGQYQSDSSTRVELSPMSEKIHDSGCCHQ